MPRTSLLLKKALLAMKASTSNVAMAVAAGAAVLAAPPSMATSLGSDAFMYGIDDDNNIYEVNPVLGTKTLVNPLASVLTNSQGSNGIAYDATRGHVYFFYDNGPTDPNYKLYMWDRKSQGAGSLVEIASGATALGSRYSPANAMFLVDSINYFTANNDAGSNTFYSLQLDFSGPIPTPSSLGVVNFQGAPAMDSAPNTNGFGDIAIDPINGIFYGSRNNGNFFKIDGGDNIYTLISNSSGISGGLQLSFDATYSKLYGTSRTTGDFYEVDLATGQVGAPLYNIGTPGFRDLGGAASRQPVPAPLPLLGAGVAMARLRRMRQLSRSLQART